MKAVTEVNAAVAMKAVVAVVGVGLLAELVAKELSSSYQVDRCRDFSVWQSRSVKLVLLIEDRWEGNRFLQAEKELQKCAVPWLYGFICDNEAVIGPFVRPGALGCAHCADYRRRNLPEVLEKLMSQLITPNFKQAIFHPSRTAIWQAAHMLAAEAHSVLQANKIRMERHIYLINLSTLQCSRHFFLPDPSCSLCGRMPDDSAAATNISLGSRPKFNADQYRFRSINDLKEVLIADYLDYRTGLLNEKSDHLMSIFTNVSVNLPSPTGDEITGGRSHSYKVSELTAILEGLERYCGFAPRGKKTVVHDSFNKLIENALDPVKTGVYSQNQYDLQDFPYEPFDPDQAIDWVWGYSFGQARAILVPEQLAYYSWGGGFVQETSNGCAIGGSLEEAILYGILEIVERDSFLMTWYAKLPVPRLDPASTKDIELQLMIERMQIIAGYDVFLFNTTMENGIPSIWAMAKNRKRHGANIVCSAGAHLDPMRAAKSAIHELDNNLLVVSEKMNACQDEAKLMLADASLVRQMCDHSTLYSLSEASERLHFLLDRPSPMVSFEETFQRTARHHDLTDDLKDILQTFRQLNLDVIVVDQTSAEISRNGLSCVKVLIPGMLPMTFGHHLTRLTGLDRVLRIPCELGYVKQMLVIEQLNPYPHPFP